MSRIQELALYSQDRGRYLDPRSEAAEAEEQMLWHLKHPQSPRNQPAKATTQIPPKGNPSHANDHRST